ncbi:MAG: VCBS repeat-containing protein, partial [ANME-2 cluster archaeon]|nr:VCBS repeat-containing protein [ANME-2 cluster archaeon]
MKLRLITIFFLLLWIVHPVCASFNITTQESPFPVSVGEEIPAAVFIGDINGNGLGEILVEAYGNLFLYDSSTGMVNTISPLQSAHHFSVMKMPNPVAGNIAGDGKLEIVFGDKAVQKLYVWDSNGTLITGFPMTLAGDIYSTPALADIDGDGLLEIAIGCEGNMVYLIDGNGVIFPNWPVVIGGGVHSQPAFGDIDGDGELEIVVTAQDNKVYAFNVDGSNVTGWPQSVSGFEVVLKYTSPALGDIDNDGEDEVVVATTVEGNLYSGKVI